MSSRSRPGLLGSGSTARACTVLSCQVIAPKSAFVQTALASRGGAGREADPGAGPTGSPAPGALAVGIAGQYGSGRATRYERSDRALAYLTGWVRSGGGWHFRGAL